MSKQRLLVSELFPELTSELGNSLVAEGEPNLAAQLEFLTITELCGCDDDFCASFFTEPAPRGLWGEHHRNVEPATDSGMVVLDVVDETIRFVEILFRDDIRTRLQQAWSAGG